MRNNYAINLIYNQPSFQPLLTSPNIKKKENWCAIEQTTRKEFGNFKFMELLESFYFFGYIISVHVKHFHVGYLRSEDH